MTRRTYYWDKETQKFIEGYPPDPNPKFGVAPMFFSDEMPRMRHPKTGEVIDSRSRWRRVDKANGCITTSPTEKINRRPRKDYRQKSDEMMAAINKTIAQIDSGTAPMSEETRERCRQQNDLMSSALNFDAHNVLGRKKKNGTRR